MKLFIRSPSNNIDITDFSDLTFSSVYAHIDQVWIHETTLNDNMTISELEYLLNQFIPNDVEFDLMSGNFYVTLTVI